MNILLPSLMVFFCSTSVVLSDVLKEQKQIVNAVSSTHIINWSIGLIIVLAFFFGCVWFMKKMGAIPDNSKGNMHVINGLSLGMREKLVLVQVGEKQLVLGVTPGRIEKLLILEGEDKLQQKKSSSESGFSEKFKQVMSGTTNE